MRGLAQRAGAHESAARPFHPPFPDPLVTRALWRIVKQERPDVVHAHSPIVHSFIPLKRLSRARLVLTMHDYGAICALRMLMRDGVAVQRAGPAQVQRPCAVQTYGAARGARARDGAARRTARARRRRFRDRGERRRRAGVRGAAAPDRGRAELPAPRRRRLGAARGAPGVAPGGRLHPLRRRARREQGRRRPPARVRAARRSAAARADRHARARACPDTARARRDRPPRSRRTTSSCTRGWARPSGVVPSVWGEPCPTTALEAAASGTPLVASRIGGLPEIVADGETGLLVHARRCRRARGAPCSGCSATATSAARWARPPRRAPSASSVDSVVARLEADLRRATAARRDRAARHGAVAR